MVVSPAMPIKTGRKAFRPQKICFDIVAGDIEFLCGSHSVISGC
jgi:hypothetical protein